MIRPYVHVRGLFYTWYARLHRVQYREDEAGYGTRHRTSCVCQITPATPSAALLLRRMHGMSERMIAHTWHLDVLGIDYTKAWLGTWPAHAALPQIQQPILGLVVGSVGVRTCDRSFGRGRSGQKDKRENEGSPGVIGPVAGTEGLIQTPQHLPYVA